MEDAKPSNASSNSVMQWNNAPIFILLEMEIKHGGHGLSNPLKGALHQLFFLKQLMLTIRDQYITWLSHMKLFVSRKPIKLVFQSLLNCCF